jgi:phage terminase large subunit
MCGSRLRASVVPYQQLIGDCNPDKPTHWLKLREAQTLTKFYHSTLRDNPKYFHGTYKGKFYEEWTPIGQAYHDRMDRLTGVRRSRLFLGLWVAAEGVVYERWDPLVNRIYSSQLPENWQEWPRYWAIDWGFIHPIAWGEYIENPRNGQLILINQIYKTKLLVEDMAKMVASAVNGRMPRAIICDHDATDRATFEKHIAIAMGQTKMLTVPAYKHISTGIQNLDARIAPHPRWDGQPGFLVVRDSLCHPVDSELKEAGLPTCMEEEPDGYVWDVKENDKANSKKDEIPIDKDNHGVDHARYMAAFVDDLAVDPQESEETGFLNEEIDSCISPF